MRDQSRGVRVASGITPKLVILARRGKVECYTLANSVFTLLDLFLNLKSNQIESRKISKLEFD